MQVLLDLRRGRDGRFTGAVVTKPARGPERHYCTGATTGAKARAVLLAQVSEVLSSWAQKRRPAAPRKARG